MNINNGFINRRRGYGKKADRHKISSIFYNRIKVGMPLQTDPTVLYSLGKHKERVTYKDTEVVSPYNTYQVKGLPPSPISMQVKHQ